MGNFPKSSQELTRLLGAALATEGNSGLEEVDGEDLALLCLGDFGSIPAQRRNQLLERIAANPAAAELVAELRAAGWGAEKKLNDPGIFLLRASAWGWAVAACLTIGLGCLQLISPPTQPGNVSAPSGPSWVVIPLPSSSAAPQSPATVQNPENAGNPLPRPTTRVMLPPEMTPMSSGLAAPPPAKQISAEDWVFYSAVEAMVLLTIPAWLWIRLRSLRNRAQ
jgi:hypothetical protein